jgi:hypothetical protein
MPTFSKTVPAGTKAENPLAWVHNENWVEKGPGYL